MRILELLLAITMMLSIFPLYFKLNRRNNCFRFCPSLSLIVAILQIFIEGYRWQMVPAYILATLLFLFTIRNLRYFYKSSTDLKIKDRKWLRLIAASTSALLLIIAILAPPYLNANIAKIKNYPVLIFNHGSVSVPSLHTALMEDLASHGYIIFSIGHADYTPFFVKPDGQIKAFDPNNEEYQSKMRENNDDEVREIANNLMSSNDLKEQESLLRQFLESNPQNQRSNRRWADDISFIVDELEKNNNESSIFTGKLDLDRLGVFGNSFGGAASIQMCITDKRFKAAVNIDCIQFGDFLDNEPTQPMMFISSDQYKGKNDLFLEIKKNPIFLVLVKGTTHPNFSDMSLWGGILKMQMLGTIDGKRCQEIQNNYIRAFFDKYLKGEDSGLLNGPSLLYPEVEIKVKNVQ